ncbi:MAG TPA: ABC transporter permease [Gemmatimonadales bacterium]|nr:ABC transporter permease [Gemmatimonadales bacterium]
MNLANIASIGIGFETLRANPLRTVLSTLGVIIGVASLVAILSLGDGMERLGREEIERTTDVQTVALQPQLTEEIDGQTVPRSDYPVFTQADADELRRMADIAGVSMTLQGSAVAEGQAGNRRPVTIVATLADNASFQRLEFADGRYFTEVEADRNAPVAVVSNRLAKELAANGEPSDLLGASIRLNGEPRRVIGILSSFRGERARLAYVPLRSAKSLLPPSGRPRAPAIYLKARSLEQVPALQAAGEDWLARRYGRWEGRVKVETSAQRLEQVRRGMNTFKLFLGAITGISLVVGGIGIMNVLLASVTERTREIGVRKALGARPRDVLLQFLSESVAISGLGSGIGVLLGVTAAFGITAVVRAQTEAQLYAAFSGQSLLVVVAAALFVGVAFGIYPALRASRLSPIDAIRHE